MLHLIQTKEGLAKCRKVIQQEDAVVFLAEGVTCQEPIFDCDVYVNHADLDRFDTELVDGVQSCNMADIVNLTSLHTSSATWR